MDPSRFDAAICNTPNLEQHAKHAAARAMHVCRAPVFEAATPLTCLLRGILNLFLFLALVVLLILTLGSESVRCQIRQLQFRMKHCRTGNSDPGIDLNDPYQQHVHAFRLLYGKDAAWEQWMLDNRDRYEEAFRRSTAKPENLQLSFRYHSNTPIAYSPPWTSEADHMDALETFLKLTFPGYSFEFFFGTYSDSFYANVIAGIPQNNSRVEGRTVFLYYETILGHEFAHVMAIGHHYDSDATIGDNLHMPPGEVGCLMDRTQSQFCSACRTALRIPLNADNTNALVLASARISNRYPY